MTGKGGEAMTKVELINQVAAKTGITKKDAGACVEAFSFSYRGGPGRRAKRFS